MVNNNPMVAAMQQMMFQAMQVQQLQQDPRLQRNRQRNGQGQDPNAMMDPNAMNGQAPAGQNQNANANGNANADGNNPANGNNDMTQTDQRVMALQAQLAVLDAEFKKLELRYNELVRKMSKEEDDPKEFASDNPIKTTLGMQRTTFEDVNKEDIEKVQADMSSNLTQSAEIHAVIATLMQAQAGMAIPQGGNFGGMNMMA